MTVPPRIDTPPAPTLIGRRYAVERELGRGASAFVYLARDAAQDRRVAVKVLRPELAQSLDAARFLREIRTTAKLQHPRIVSVLDQGAEGDQFYWVAPYLDGGSLRDRLTRERQLPIRTAVAIAHAIAVALDFAHTHGVIHRDVKPENILFVGDEACLGDFGIARARWTTRRGGRRRRDWCAARRRT
ncbi:protein kinase [Gemmatirosa kalamazoonensis]|uniref:Protein kinase n=1 Tax=Gemmatirosa kalamazoonensis TaxID=861299 RepID=W0REG3_9BACT|nr:serine/threonine-protein kinase [Gemmatirosa kalamazoonensis]AHG87763.1 protein kinase [Gemmatirosa kalamazoonensis]